MKNIISGAALLLALAISLGARAEAPFEIEVVDTFDEPWAIASMPDGRFLLTEKKGTLLVVDQDGQRSRRVGGIPDVVYWGQGGMGDVVTHPEFSDNGVIYLSYVEAGVGDSRGAAVARGVLDESGR
ncbi:MAG: PQQ-dependent sugar dehydrogenase, partial [Pseudomonadota bacterium]